MPKHADILKFRDLCSVDHIADLDFVDYLDTFDNLTKNSNDQFNIDLPDGVTITAVRDAITEQITIVPKLWQLDANSSTD